MNKFKGAVTIASSMVLASVPLLAFGQIGAGGESIPSGFQSVTGFRNFITSIGNFLFAILLVIAVIFIIFAAYKYLVSGGDPEKVKSASNTLLYALVAVVVALLARGLVSLVKTFVSTSVPGT